MRGVQVNQRELQELARSLWAWTWARTLNLYAGHAPLMRVSDCAGDVPAEEYIREVLQRAVESAVEKACKAVCQTCAYGEADFPGHGGACKAIRRAFSPASPDEEPRRGAQQVSGRPETGVMQFGDDWPGVFIRGDNAAGYAMELRRAEELLAAAGHAWIARNVGSLADLLFSSDVQQHTTPQMVKPWQESRAGEV